MDTISLKKYIYKHEKIEFILEKIGCHDIQYHERRNYYSAAQPDGDNLQGVNIRNSEYLNYRSFSRGVDYDDNEDLISLIQNVKHFSFIETIKYLHQILGLDYKWSQSQKKSEQVQDHIDPLQVFKKVRNRRKIDVAELTVLDENLLNDYIPILHINWLREGVMPWTAKKFGLAYSYKRHRVIIPMRYWLTGELLGINSRTTLDNYKELGFKKFFITPSYQKGLNLFGLYENYDAIQKAGYVIVYEAEKSVLKRDSLNDSTGVALSGHTITDEQVRILVGLNVDIIISLDNDIPIQEVRHICEKFRNIRNVYYTIDKWHLLKTNDSIADVSNKNFEFLFNNKIKYDANKHREYLKGLGKK